VQLDHPIDDPSLPSYRHPALRELQEDLERAYDAFHCLRDSKAKYLPQEPEEPPEAYKARLNRAVFTDFFRDSIHAFAGVLSKFALKDPPDSLEAAAANIDLEGNSLTAWFQQADTLMLRDGAALLCVDMPPGQPGSAAEELAMGRRPYFLLRSRSKALNWRVTVANGVESLERVTFLETVEVEDGEFGVKIEPRYRVVGRGAWALFKIERNASNDLEAILIDQGEYIGANGQPLPVVPVVWYASDQAGFGHGELPLRQVVEHCIEHFQRRSDLREKDHKVNMPVPVAIGRTPPAPGQRQKPLVIGPNSVVDLDQGGSFTFAEPSAASLSFSQAQITEVEKLIARQTLGFLYGDNQGAKTATQAGMEGAQTESAITRIAERKASAMQQLMAIWCLFTGEQLDDEAGLSMSSSIYERPMEAADVSQLQQLAGGVELISQRSAIEELQRAGRLKVTTSVEEELERLAAERPEPAEDVGLNDLGGLPPIEDPDDLEEVEEPET
jgi:hypothetical protein